MRFSNYTISSAEMSISGCTKRDTDVIERRLSINPVILNLIWLYPKFTYIVFATIHTHTNSVHWKRVDESNNPITTSSNNLIVNVIPH